MRGGFGQQAGGFGQQQRPAGGGFGQQQQGGGFGQQQQGGGFGQQQRPAGGFGQQQGGGFGQQQQQGGFGQQQGGGFGQQGGGFGQQQPAAGGFGQQQQGGFGQQQGGGFGQQGGGFGQQQPAAGGFGQQQQGGFGQQQGGGFGQQQQGGGFGQQQQQGGFGQQQQGGFGQQQGGGFGQQQQAGGFGQQQQRPGGFGQQPAAGGFGQPAAGGFGQQPAAGGFGQPAAGGFGQQQRAGGFGQQPAAGGFGQQPAAGGFGQQPAAGGFGQPAAGGFGQPVAGGFGQPAAGGFGQQQAAGGFGQPAAGFGQGGFAAPLQPPAPQAVPPNVASLADFNNVPYGNSLLLMPVEAAVKSAAESKIKREDPHPKILTNTAPFVRQQRVNLTTPTGLRSTTDITARHHAASVNFRPSQRLEQANVSAQGFQFHENNDDDVSRYFAAADVDRQTSAVIEQQIASGRSDFATNNLSSTQAPNQSAVAPSSVNREYLMDPSLDMLLAWPASLLMQVPSFRIMRLDGRCEVLFLAPVNLIRCNIDHAIHLDKSGQVTFYPHGDEPAFGFGLRVRARVTIRGIVNTSVAALQEKCRSMSALFESYDASQRVWTYIANASEDELLHQGHHSNNQDTPNGSSPSALPEIEASPVNPPSSDVSDRWSAVPHDGPRGSMPALFARDSRGTNFFNGRRDDAQRVHSDEGSLQEIELPYELPTFSVFHPRRQLLPQTALFLVPDAFPVAPLAPGVLLVAKSKSVTLKSKDPKNAMCMQGRSFRVGWSRSGEIALPTFSSLRDATTTVPSQEVSGAGVRIVKPLQSTDWGKNRSAKTLSVLLSNTVRSPTEVSSSPPALLATEVPILHKSVVSLIFGERGSAGRLLSDDKCSELIASLSSHSDGHLQDLIALFAALFGTAPDKAFDNPREELRFQRELRRKKFAEWLGRDDCGELNFNEEGNDHAEPWRAVLKELLRHRFPQARNIAAATTSSPSGIDETTRKYLAVQGGGARYGKYFSLHKGLVAAADLPTEASQTIKLILGELEPFLRRPAFTFNSNGVPTRNPNAISWKQVLGIVFHHCCPPTHSVKDVLYAFFSRVDFHSLVPHYYDATVDASTRRNQDVIRVGKAFRDASALLLHAYAESSTPVPTPSAMEVSPQILHPNAFGYHGYDYFGPFLTAVLLRSLGIKRTHSYQIAEQKAYIGFLEQTAQFSTSRGEWAYGLLAASLILDDASRFHAFKMLINQHVLPRGMVTDTDLLQSVCGALGVDRSVFQFTGELETPNKQVTKLAPSMESNAKLMRALKQFSISGASSMKR